MYELHPKYYKTIKIRFFQRIVNGLTAFFNGLTEGLKLIIKCPIHGLQGFAQMEAEVVDRELLAKDLSAQQARAQEQQAEQEDNVIKHEHHHKVDMPDDDEDWKKQHEAEYGE